MPLTRFKLSAIEDGGIATADLADGAITTAKIADSAVTSVKTRTYLLIQRLLELKRQECQTVQLLREQMHNLVIFDLIQL